MTSQRQANELVSDPDDETQSDAAQARLAGGAAVAAAARSITVKAVAAQASAVEAVAAEAIAAADVATEAIAAADVATEAAAEMVRAADKTATAMVIAAKVAADKAAETAQRTALAVADVAARNVAEVVRNAAVTAEAMVVAASAAAEELVAASRHRAGTHPTELAHELAARAASTAEAMVAAAAAAAAQANDRARRDSEEAAQIAAQAVADIVREATVTAEAMVTAATAAATAAAERAAERARHEAYARSQSELLNAVVDSIGDGVEVVDHDGSLLMRNRAAEALGVRQDSGGGAASRPFGLFQPDGITSIPAQDTPLMRALAGESCDGVEILVRSTVHPHGVLLTVSSRPLSAPTGHPGAVAVYRDVTDERAQRTELEMFAAVAAHDLSAPLAIVSGYLEVIADLVVPQLSGDTAPTVTEVLRRACGGAARMGQLIDDLLSYATCDATLVYADFDLRTLVDDVIAARTEHVNADTPPPAFAVGALPWVHGDRARVAQVLNNLIGNALKYTVPGEPAHIEITANLADAGSGAEAGVEVQISDHGIGIPAGQHAAIFTNLHRAHPSGPYNGTGLGLAICARIVERHGGHIRASDNPAGGTRIQFTLPQAYGSEGAEAR